MTNSGIDIFISYRRLDSAVFSQWLAAQLRATYGSECVFIDTENIRSADAWAMKVERSLQAASVVIVVIGNSWLSIRDRHERRRIDLADDWVRREIETSLRDGKTVLPLLIDGSRLPAAEALPESIAGLLNSQAHKVDVDHIARDLSALVKDIGALLDKAPIAADIPYPSPMLRVKPLSAENLLRLATRLPNWRVLSHDRDGEPRTELTRTYEFECFEDVMHFMNTASRFIGRVDHHPEWTNIWRTLVVRLTTWDIGHKPSMLDVDVATYLDGLYEGYQRQFSQHDLDTPAPPA